jgi:tetratricopeptide (TPR) repeat protein
MSVTLAAKRLRPKTYSLAIYLVIAVIFIQVAALISVFWFRHRVVNVDTNAPELGASFSAVIPPPSIRLPPATEILPNEPGNLEMPTDSGRLNLKRARDVSARIAGLNEEANKFRQQGEFKLASAALLEAEKLDNKNTVTLSGLALLAEAESHRDLAKQYWQRVVELGPGAGNAYMLAKERLIIAEQLAVVPVDGQALFIDSIQQKTSPLGQEPFVLSLKITMGSKGFAESFDSAKLKIELFFYDLRKDGKVGPSVAEIKTKWADERVDWKNRQNEILEATYTLPANLAEERKFYGYVFRIFYKGVLQDQRLQPSELLQLFPNLRS